MTDPTALLDLYYVLVEVIFGNILLAGFGVAVLFLIIGILMRMSPLLMLFIIGMFIVTFGVGWGGSIFAMLAILAGLIYFGISLGNAINKSFV